MEEILNIFKNYSLEVFLIAAGAFLLTYLIKWPIKKLTSKLSEAKRKMVNIVIMFIPLILSTAANIVYSGYTTGIWFSLNIVEASISAWVLSLSLYAIVSRIWLVIKGICEGKVNKNLPKETIAYIKSNIKEISAVIKVDEKTLEKIVAKLEELEKLKNLISSDTINVDEVKLNEVTAKYNELKEQESIYLNKINSNKEITEKYKQQLYSTNTADKQ